MTVPLSARPWLLLLASLILSGCATTSLFTPYPDQARSWQQALASGDDGAATAAVARLARGTDSRDRLLFLQEQGRTAQIAGDLDTSQAAFAQAIELYQAQDTEARLRASSAVSGTASLLSNDNALAYRGQEYERIAAIGMQALNYWQRGDLDGAAVEFRRLVFEQRQAEQRNADRIARAERDDAPVNMRQLDDVLGGLDTAAAGVRSSVQNAYYYYLAGVFREGIGDYNDATVDYKKAYEIQPLGLLEDDIRRLDGLQRGRDLRRGQALGELVVAYEQGFVPARLEISLPIPTVHGLLAVAFPTYAGQTPPAAPLQVSVAGQGTLDTTLLTRFDALAARALREEAPALITRQLLRATAKYQTQKAAEDQLGVWGGLAAQLYNIVSERADLRSWLTLPANGQVGRMLLPEGTHTVTLAGRQGGRAQVQVPVSRNGITLIRVIDTGPLHVTVLPVLEKRS